MAGHNHLDQRRRERGLCDACDRLWAWQDQRVDECQWEEVAVQHGMTQRRRLWLLGETRYIRRRKRRT